ncbi:MAG: Rieske 2Fe-2S domain-containing protein, partial [Burkholderiaceae bacterium]
MFVKNCWYVAGWDTDVDSQALFTRTICNEPVLFYRDATGQLVALEDRCCHRSAP